MKLLLTGPPGVGKTTVVVKLCERLDGLSVGGFYTQERREGGRRVGFEAVPVAGGDRRTMAHVSFVSSKRVGRYGVDVEMVDYVADTTLGLRPRRPLYVIDEVGEMECLSARFVRGVERLLDADAPLVATVAARGGGLIGAIKDRDDVEMIEVTTSNRNQLAARLYSQLEGLVK